MATTRTGASTAREGQALTPDAAAGPPEDTQAPPAPPSSGRFRPRRSPYAGAVTTGLAVLLAAVVTAHDRVPDTPWHLGSLVETLLPWTALAIPALTAAALLRRSRVATVSLLLPVTVWLTVFGGTLTDKSSPGGDLTVVSHNVNQDNPDPEGTVRGLVASGADVLALVELGPATAPAYERALAPAYPYHFYEGTVGLWSTHPLRDAHSLPIMPWTRAMRATVETPEGPLAAYVVHLPSVRVNSAGFTTGARDEALRRLTAELPAEDARPVVVMGDFNGVGGDRALRPLTRHFDEVQSTAGAGFGFTWPSRFPMVRIDQIFVKGAKATSARTLPATASDHLPVAARLDLGPAAPA
ncbi:endonuclease/exonuclease/phosphatase family protein [Streptomyces sp. CHD11]|uniref:endonuclease/exonuclease/phosphatase family protein n=1 Tax=Streptomyces sp. CHD11 TaxID=2741325 RepID=UPI001BFC1319|nr:endonuclease/exonuclease/phosphatase family protein [Streptomyces sp. CHD11]MBT3150159.1 endonuclease/exonuclease/phosphatase family protein [Streptomyces sp. CHD11]